MSNISTFGAFTTARLGIYASMAGLTVTGNNISNINTYGYTRQALDQMSFYSGAADRYAPAYGNIGQGVLVTGVSQLRDPYLDIRYRNEQASVGAMTAKLNGLSGLSTILDEVGKGNGDGVIEKQLKDLIDKLNTYNTENAGKDEFDSLVRSSADSLVKLFNSYAGKLEGLQQDADKAFRQDLERVNTVMSRIRDLNQSIRKSEIRGDNALELRDERNLLLDELSGYVKINVTYEKEDIGEGLTIENLVVNLDDPNKTLLIHGIYGSQMEIRQTPVPNPKYDETYIPDDVDNLTDADKEAMYPYLDKDKKPVEKKEDAAFQDSPNYDLNVTALKDNNGKYYKTTDAKTTEPYVQGDPKSLENIQAEIKAAIEALMAADDQPGGDATGLMSWTGKDPDTGETITTTFRILSKQQIGADGKPIYNTVTGADGTETRTPVMEYTYETTVRRTHDVARELGDNDLYGALQSSREILTETGEFATQDAVDMDGKAATKRGIPYYRNALDALANKFASVLNDANQPYRVDVDGNYVDKHGNQVYDMDGKALSSKDTLTDDQKAVLEGETFYRIAPTLSWTAPDETTPTNYADAYVDADGKPILGDDGKPLTIAKKLEDMSDNERQKIAKDAVTTDNMPDPATGYTYTKNEGGQRVGSVLFSNSSTSDDTTEINASNISIADGWSAGSPRIQISAYTDDAGKPILSTDNSNILHILAQFDTDYVYTPGELPGDPLNADVPYYEGTFNGMLANMNNILGEDTAETMVMLDNYSASALDLDTSRDSVSSVDLNDEATNLMQYQKSYSAACRLMTTIDEALDKLINGTGVVGR